MAGMIFEGAFPSWSDLRLIRSGVDRRSETTEDLSGLWGCLGRVLLGIAVRLPTIVLLIS